MFGLWRKLNEAKHGGIQKNPNKIAPLVFKYIYVFFTGLLILKGATSGSQIMYNHCFLLVPPPSWNQNTMRRLHFPLFQPQKYLWGLIKRSLKIYFIYI